MSRSNKLVSYGLVIITLLILAIVAFYFLSSGPFAPQPGVEAVKGQELRDYEGVRLS